MTCQEAENNQNACKCRICGKEIKKQFNTNIPAFKECCGAQDCVAELAKCCVKILPCGHMCKGFRDEKTCLPCLEEACIAKHNTQVINKTEQLLDG